MHWFKDKKNRPPMIDFDTFLLGALCICDVVWNTRNKAIHDQPRAPLYEEINRVRNKFRDHSTQKTSKTTLECRREGPPPTWVDCCTDVSIDIDQAFGAAVFRDDKNRIVAIVATRFSFTNPTLAEAHIMVGVVEYAISRGFQKVCFYSDCAAVVGNFNGNMSQLSQLQLEGITQRYKEIIPSLEQTKLKKTDRQHNFVAHNAAKWARIHALEGEMELHCIDIQVFSENAEWFPD